MTHFAEALARADGGTTIVELVPWPGPLQDPAGDRARAMARELVGDPRVTALTITDNAGGAVKLGPLTFGRAIREMGGEVVVHVACRDRSRAALQTTAYGLASEGLTNVLALSGDYPREGFGGRSRAVFDIDSVGLVTLLRDLSARGPGFTIGCAVNPFKALERDLVPQLHKLAMKARAGADLAITQVGWDARSWSELQAWNQLRGPGMPLLASVYILSRPVANVFHGGGVPGIRASAALLSWVERQAASPDKGRAAFLELAARQVAVARGLGYAGVYLAGQRSSAEVDTVLRLADGFSAAWRSLLGDVSFPEPGPHRLFETGELPQLAGDRPTKRTKPRRPPLVYRFDRLVHDRVFDPSSAGFALGRRFYGAAEAAHLGRPAHVLEQAVKIPLFGCRDCGDCSLPDTAYQCPEGACAKNQRNGPCGGSLMGQCEVPGRPCIWAEAYERLKAYGEEQGMLEREPVLQDDALRGTSAWANTFLGRDHEHFGTRGEGT